LRCNDVNDKLRITDFEESLKKCQDLRLYVNKSMINISKRYSNVGYGISDEWMKVTTDFLLGKIKPIKPIKTPEERLELRRQRRRQRYQDSGEIQIHLEESEEDENSDDEYDI
jgi:hypothetical protein